MKNNKLVIALAVVAIGGLCYWKFNKKKGTASPAPSDKTVSSTGSTGVNIQQSEAATVIPVDDQKIDSVSFIEDGNNMFSRN